MHPLVPIRRSAEHLIFSSAAHVCRPCQLRIAAFQQRSVKTQPKRPIKNPNKKTRGPLPPWLKPAKVQARLPANSLKKAKEGKKTLTIEEPELLDLQTRETASVNENAVEALERMKDLLDDPKKDPNYVEALTWEGLETIGSESWVEKLNDKGDTYVGFANKQTWDPSSNELRPFFEKTAARYTRSGMENRTSMGFPEAIVKAKIIREMYKETGIRLSDSKINNCKTLGQLAAAYEHASEPKKTTESLKLASIIGELANVKVSDRRVTPIDKETEVGRWKIIEQELNERGLPVTGHIIPNQNSIVTRNPIRI